MTPADRETFESWMLSLQLAYDVPPDPRRVEAYWQALRDQPLEAVRAAIEEALRQVTETRQRPPTAPQLRLACRRARLPRAELATPAEIAAYEDAQAAGWERPPCECRECRVAGVATTPQRYVPEDDIRPLGRPGGGGPVSRGRWIHGHELARWLQARDRWRVTLADVCRRRGWSRLEPSGGAIPSQEAPTHEPDGADPG